MPDRHCEHKPLGDDCAICDPDTPSLENTGKPQTLPVESKSCYAETPSKVKQPDFRD